MIYTCIVPAQAVTGPSMIRKNSVTTTSVLMELTERIKMRPSAHDHHHAPPAKWQGPGNAMGMPWEFDILDLLTEINGWFETF